MKNKQHILKVILLVLSFLFLILDSQTVILGVKEGLELCIRSVFPSLFPFVLISNALITVFSASPPANHPPSNPLRQHLTLLLTGFLGGYPVGANGAVQAYRNRQLNRHEAQRMMIICNNPGPAFIFGIAAQNFHQPWVPWLLWGTHIVSSVIISWLYPSNPSAKHNDHPHSPSHKLPVLTQGIFSMAHICGWVMVFRSIIQILQKWCLWMLPREIQIIICGLLEMTNGCIQLNSIDCMGLRLSLCALFLSFGGLCTVIQTRSITEEIGCHGYLTAKIFQGGFSFLLMYFLQHFFLPADRQYHISAILFSIIVLCLVFLALLMRKKKNNSRIPVTIGV